MLKTRVIPTLLSKNVGLVKGVGFDSWRRVGSVLPAIKVYNLREVDELIFLDIRATLERRGPDLESLAEYTAESFVPLTYGGGIRTLEDIRGALLAGADKVAINSAAYDHPEIVREASARFGSQCIVLSVDARRMPDGTHRCFSHSGTQDRGIEVVDWVRRAQDLAAGEILLTSIDRDGSMRGYDLDLIRKVVSAVSVPVIASGGAGAYDHMLEALSQGGASAIAAASIFHFTEQTPLEAKRFLKGRGIPVRLYDEAI